MTKPLLAFLIVVSFVSGVLCTFAAVSFTVSVRNVGVIKTVGVSVYEDPNLTVPLTMIDWGFLEPREHKNFTGYILNEGNVPIILEIYADNWQPVNASQYFTFTSTCDGVQVVVDSSVQVIFSLAVDPEIAGVSQFSFDIWVVGVG